MEAYILNEENKMETNSDENKGKSLIEIKVSDVLGLSKAAGEARKATENIVKSVEKGLGKFSDPMMKVINAKADAKAEEITSLARLESQKNELNLYLEFVNSLKASEAPPAAVALVGRTIERQIIENSEKQLNREHVANLLFQELPHVNEGASSNEEIDEDWLSSFWSFVEQKSSEDIQRIYARILAGECLKPGSYSSRLLQILSVMTKKDAHAFEAICSMSISDEGGAYLIEPLDEFDNFLEEEILSTPGLNEFTLHDLESLGLLGRSSIMAFSEGDNGRVKNIGGITCSVKITDSELLRENEHYITAIPFSKPAEELRSIISITPNDGYYRALTKFASEFLGVELKEATGGSA